MSRYGRRGSDINKYPSVVSNIMRIRDEKRIAITLKINGGFFFFFGNYHISVEIDTR